MADNEISRQAARNALQAYMASEGMTDEPETAIVDLIADLAFLAEFDHDVSGEYVITQGAYHYTEDIKDGASDQYSDDEDDFGPLELEAAEDDSDSEEVLSILQAEQDEDDDDWGDDDEDECPGHESLDGAHMGETVYCDGSCITCR